RHRGADVRVRLVDREAVDHRRRSTGARRDGQGEEQHPFHGRPPNFASSAARSSSLISLVVPTRSACQRYTGLDWFELKPSARSIRSSPSMRLSKLVSPNPRTPATDAAAVSICQKPRTYVAIVRRSLTPGAAGGAKQMSRTSTTGNIPPPKRVHVAPESVER